MQFFPESLFSYLLALGISVLFAFLSENQKKYKRIYRLLSMLSVIIFCSIRFYVGNDYSNYVSLFQQQSRFVTGFLDQSHELVIYLIIKIFSSIQAGYIYMFASFSIITYTILFELLKKFKIIKWGVFYIYTLGFLIMANDQIRQAPAILLFFLSIQFIINKEPLKFLGAIILASFFHYSALLMIPFYIILRLNPDKKFLTLLLIISFFIGSNGLFIDLIFSIISYIPRYGQLYALKDRFVSEASGSGLGLLFKNFCALISIMYYNRSTYKVYILAFIIGTILVNLSYGFMPLERLAYYLLYLNFIVFPLLLNENRKSIILKSVSVLTLLYFILVSSLGLEKHGAVPYRTLFGENLNSYNTNYIND